MLRLSFALDIRASMVVYLVIGKRPMSLFCGGPVILVAGPSSFVSVSLGDCPYLRPSVAPYLVFVLNASAKIVRRRKDGSYGALIQVYFEFDPLTGSLSALDYPAGEEADVLSALARAFATVQSAQKLT